MSSNLFKIGLPAALFLASAAWFGVLWLRPELVDFGGVSAAGLGIFGASASFLWLLVALALRKPPADNVKKIGDPKQSEDSG